MARVEMAFTIEFCVNDEKRFRAAAYARAKKDGISEEEARAFKFKTKSSLQDCAVMLFDPSTMEGCSIHNSSAEQF